MPENWETAWHDEQAPIQSFRLFWPGSRGSDAVRIVYEAIWTDSTTYKSVNGDTENERFLLS